MITEKTVVELKKAERIIQEQIWHTEVSNALFGILKDIKIKLSGLIRDYEMNK